MNKQTTHTETNMPLPLLFPPEKKSARQLNSRREAIASTSGCPPTYIATYIGLEVVILQSSMLLERTEWYQASLLLPNMWPLSYILTDVSMWWKRSSPLTPETS